MLFNYKSKITVFSLNFLKKNPTPVRFMGGENPSCWAVTHVKNHVLLETRNNFTVIICIK